MDRYNTDISGSDETPIFGVEGGLCQDELPADRTAENVPILLPIDERYRFTIDLSPLIPWVSDPSGSIIEIDNRISDYTGKPREACLGLRILASIHRDDHALIRESWKLGKHSKQPLDYEIRLRSKDGRYRWHRSRAAPRLDGNSDIVCWYGTIEDVHDRKTANEAVRWAADHDELTGLFNRRAFMREFTASFERARRAATDLTLMLIDLDRFKQINDRLGHHAGDALLQQVAQRLGEALPSEARAGRLGGDEFAILLDGAHGDETSQVARRIEAAFGKPFRLDGNLHPCQASIGIAVFPRDGENAAALYRCADLALYEAKGGTGIVRNFDGSVRERHQIKLSTLALAREALSRQRIFPHYQPQVDLHTGAIIGFEALLRWEHPHRGILSAGVIAEAFQEPELAVALDRQMFERIAADVHQWNALDVKFGRIAINTSVVGFHAESLASDFLRRIAAAGLSADQFELEITEDVLIGRDTRSFAQDLDRLRAAGLKVALDDFGTGYASLVHLKQFKVDVLKIDRSFVQHLADPTNAAIIGALVSLGNKLGISIVAEGIETIEQANRLYREGCDIGQGFLFSPAVSAEAVPELIHTLSDFWRAHERRTLPTRRRRS